MAVYKFGGTRRQRPVKGGRVFMPGGFIKDIETAIEKTAQRFHVSRSFVIAVACAEFFGIEEQEHFEPPATTAARVRRHLALVKKRA